jgi:hypothetical protein
MLPPQTPEHWYWLAMVAASKGCWLMLTMPEVAALETSCFKAFGAEVIFISPAAKGMERHVILYLIIYLCCCVLLLWNGEQVSVDHPSLY